MVHAPVGRAVGLDAAVIGAAVARLRFCLTRRCFGSLLRMLLLCGPRLLMSLLRFALLLALVLVLCIGTGSGSEKQEQNRCADNASSFHLSVSLNVSGLLTLSPSSLC